MKKNSPGLFKIKFFMILLFAAGIATGFFAKTYLFKDKDFFRVERLYPRGGHLTNPIMQVEGPAGGDRRLEAAKQSINASVQRFLKKEDALKISVYLRNLNKAAWAGIEEDEKFTAASLAKVPILFTFFIKAQQDPKILEKKVKYETEIQDSTQQNIAPRDRLQVGSTYTVEDLLRYMITYSDNTAMLLLANDNDIDKTLIDQLFSDLRLPTPQKGSEYEISTKDYARYFRLLYSTTYLNKDSSEKALQLLTEADFHDGIVAGVPQGVTVAHKFGERGEGVAGHHLHDCGIVYTQNPYLICVMTKGWNMETLKGIIKNISQIAYENLGKPKRE